MKVALFFVKLAMSLTCNSIDGLDESCQVCNYLGPRSTRVTNDILSACKLLKTKECCEPKMVTRDNRFLMPYFVKRSQTLY